MLGTLVSRETSLKTSFCINVSCETFSLFFASALTRAFSPGSAGNSAPNPLPKRDLVVLIMHYPLF